MNQPAKPTLDEHKTALTNDLHAQNIFSNPTMYTIYMNGLADDLKNRNLSLIMDHVQVLKGEYVEGVDLFYGSHQIGDIELKIKPLESLFDKLYRKNILQNGKWIPDQEPKIAISQCHEKVDDLFRTRMICRYMDGPKFLCKHLADFCDAQGIENNCRSVITPLGYHAWHFYLKQELDDFNGGGASHVWIELQFTTQLAEVITSLTHVHYEAARSGGTPTPNWQWDVYSNEFRPAYIGHGLHLLEGIIQEFRDDVLKHKGEDLGDTE